MSTVKSSTISFVRGQQVRTRNYVQLRTNRKLKRSLKLKLSKRVCQQKIKTKNKKVVQTKHYLQENPLGSAKKN